MTDEARAALRAALIAGPGDAVLSPEEAAALLDVSESWLGRSDVPRTTFNRRTKYLKSECLAYAQAHLTHRIAS